MSVSCPQEGKTIVDFAKAKLAIVKKKKTTFKKVLKSHSKNLDNVFVKSKKLKITYRGEQNFSQIRRTDINSRTCVTATMSDNFHIGSIL